jgi:hypothetical protein
MASASAIVRICLLYSQAVSAQSDEPSLRNRSGARTTEQKMKPYPHTYTTQAGGPNDGPLTVTSTGLPDIATSSSPETLPTSAVANRLVLTFGAVAQARSFELRRLDCRVGGVLKRAENGCLIANSLRGTRALVASVVESAP